LLLAISFDFFFGANAKSSGYSLRRGKMIQFIGNQIKNRTTPKTDKRITSKE
jgi:hypothetical protein